MSTYVKLSVKEYDRLKEIEREYELPKKTVINPTNSWFGWIQTDEKVDDILISRNKELEKQNQAYKTEKALGITVDEMLKKNLFQFCKWKRENKQK